MALRLQFLSVIVPRAAFARCPGLPDWFAALAPSGGFYLDTCWFDAHLWCETAMDGEFARFLLDRWEDEGLRLKTADGAWADVCLAAAAQGPLGPCPWLAYDPASDSVWLAGTDPGDVIGGQSHLARLEAESLAAEAEGEAAYRRMYESRRPKEPYEDAHAALSRALSVARFLNLPDEAEQLAARISHLDQVYRSQFRGW